MIARQEILISSSLIIQPSERNFSAVFLRRDFELLQRKDSSFQLSFFIFQYQVSRSNWRFLLEKKDKKFIKVYAELDEESVFVLHPQRWQYETRWRFRNLKKNDSSAASGHARAVDLAKYGSREKL